MKMPRSIRLSSVRTAAIAAVLMTSFAVAHSAIAQQSAQIKIRNVTSPSSISNRIGAVDELREIGGGRVLVNDGNNHALLLFDATLQHPVALMDTVGALTAYPRFGKLISYTGDSSLFYEADSRTLVVIDDQGKLGRVLALPHPQDFNSITSGGAVATDGRGHLIYQGQKTFGIRTPCTPSGAAAAPRAQATAPSDSVDVIRANFETRVVDTVARARTSIAGVAFPVTTNDVNCNMTGAKIQVNPSIPPTDSWVVTSHGAIAIVRSHDYHVDWINNDGSKRSTPKMPFDWRRLSDADKQAKVDSAKHIIDSVTAKGGYRLKACGGGRSISFSVAPPTVADGSNASGRSSGGSSTATVGGGGGGGGGGDASAPPAITDCQTVIVTANFVPLDSMADYIAPIREYAARADVDGNVWILPSTSSSARGGLLYDVVNEKGEIAERVQLPSGRTIAGFGKNGVLYLRSGDYKSGYVIEKVKIIR